MLGTHLFVDLPRTEWCTRCEILDNGSLRLTVTQYMWKVHGKYVPCQKERGLMCPMNHIATTSNLRVTLCRAFGSRCFTFDDLVKTPRRSVHWEAEHRLLCVRWRHEGCRRHNIWSDVFVLALYSRKLNRARATHPLTSVDTPKG